MTRSTLRALTLIAAIWSVLTACSTYKTLDPRQDKLTSSGQSRGVDQTAGQYGQPYYLPKGLIHLVIKQESASAAQNSQTPSTASSANNNSQVVTVNTSPASTPAPTEPNPDDGTQPVAYKITVDRVIVPDLTTGPYLARYEQNWLYAENVSLSVTDDGLLSTVSTTASDRTAQILSNIEDTAINIGKFAAQGGFAGLGALKPATKETNPSIPRVRYKRLNVDVTFDPLDPNSVAGIEEIFRDQVIENKTEGNTELFSPFDFELITAYSAGYALRPKQPGATGLWFRETTPVELVFRQRTRQFRAAIRDHLAKVRTAVKTYQDQADADKTAADTANDKASASAMARTDAKKAYDQAAADKKEQAQIALNAANASADADLKESKAKDLTRGKSQTTADAAAKLLKALNETAAAPTISRSAIFIKAIPNPDRVFSFNIARSAFVQNKKIDLTITNGLLTKVAINKPSEAEGFSEIPLELSKKLAELPKDILTIRTQTTSAVAAKNTVNAQSAQAATESPAQLQTQTDQIKAEAAKIEAETKLIQDQRALQGLINGQ